MASMSEVTHPLKKCLTDNSLEDYFESFLENGYDDLEFLNKMDESDILEILQDCGVDKKGHHKKFIAILKTRTYTSEEMNEQEPAMKISGNDLHCNKCTIVTINQTMTTSQLGDLTRSAHA